MKLVGSLPSPYVRKVRVVLAERAIPYELVEESAWTATTTVPRYNPLNKVPAMVLDDGASIYDSAVITEYLDAISGGTLVASGAEARAKDRCLEALGDGIADAGIARFLDRKREAARQDHAWQQRQVDKVQAGVAAIARALGDREYLGGDAPNLGDFACACALLWVEFRMPDLKWRESDPAVGRWVARMEARPSFQATKPG
jgi:glutathione S-transferase